MLNFKKFNLLEKKYDYKFIYIKLNSENELIKLYDFLDSLLKDGKVMSRSLLDNNIIYPNYFQISTDINDDFFTYIGWLCDIPNDEILDDYIYSEPNTDSHIYDITELNKIKYILNGIYIPNYNEPRELVYESKKFPYEYVSIKVNSVEEVIIVYDFLDKLLNGKRLLKRSLIHNIERYPNYLFIETDLIKNPNINYINYLTNDVIDRDMIDRNINNSTNCDKEILTIKDLDNLKSILIFGIKNINYNKPRELVYESKNTYPFSEVVVEVTSFDEVVEIYNFIVKLVKRPLNHSIVISMNSSDISYPNYIFIPTDIYTDTTETLSYMCDRPTEEKYNRYIIESENVDSNVLTIKDLFKLKYILNPIDYNKPRQLVYESKNNKKTLYAFDLDETLVFSDRFEEKVKDLLLEYVTPETIFLNKLKEYNINLSQLKYENGRIYFTDPMNKFEIDEYNQDWVRKKDRVYLTQPEEYLLTDESTPIGSYKKIVDLYNNVDNKCIITARSEKLRRRTEKELKTFDIETPNYGLFMFSDNKFSIKSKYKCDVLLNLYYDNNFDEINYYDDNIRLLKKMKHYLKNFDININFYKVTKNEYRKI